MSFSKCSLSFLLFFSSLLGIAQSNFQLATVITNEGDSLKGLLSYSNRKQNVESFTFKNKAGIQHFNPTSVREFYFADRQERYISASVKIDDAPEEYYRAFVEKVARPELTEKTVFLLQLIKSDSLSLFGYTDARRDHFYYALGAGVPQELIYHFVFNDSSNSVYAVTTYKQQIANLTRDCPKLGAAVNTLRYTEKEIKKLLLAYLACNGNPLVVEARQDNPSQFKFGVFAGAAYNHFTFTGNGHVNNAYYNDYGKPGYKSSLSPLLGVSFDIGIQRKRNNLHFVNELGYKSYKTSNTFFVHTVLYDYKEVLQFSFSYLQLNTMLRYTFGNKENFRPFVNAGFSNAKLIKANKNSSHIAFNNGTVQTGIAFEGEDKFEQAIFFGAGAGAKFLNVEFRYALGNGFSPYVRFRSKVTSPEVIVTYLF